MATLPTVSTFGKDITAADILNSIRNEASEGYRNIVPIAYNSPHSIQAVGEAVMSLSNVRNEFCEALYNRIGRVILTSRMYSNNLAVLKKGELAFGESIEEIFTSLSEPFTYNPEEAYKHEFQRKIPKVNAAFHRLNYQKFYKTTVSQAQLKQAFISPEGLISLINDIVSKLYSAAYADEQLVMKYVIGRNILKGNMYPVEIPPIDKDFSEDIAIEIKRTSDDFEFINPAFNLVGVDNWCPKEDQYLVVSNRFNAILDVAVLAAAFNMDKVEFMAHQLRVDSFGRMNLARLDSLLGDNEEYVRPTEEELAILDDVPAVLFDTRWFQCYDMFQEFNENYVGEGLYWNYRFHQWKIYSTSPFSNAAVFVSGATPSVESITVSPESVVVSPGQWVNFAAAVQTTGFTRETVYWTVETESENFSTNDIAVDDGKVMVPKSAQAGDVITVTATSTYDLDVTGTATITVG